VKNAAAEKLLRQLAEACPEWGVQDPRGSHWWMLSGVDTRDPFPCAMGTVCLARRSVVPGRRLHAWVEFDTYTIEGEYTFLAVIGQCARCRTVYWLWRPADDK
jgi:hypothetical protein